MTLWIPITRQSETMCFANVNILATFSLKSFNVPILQSRDLKLDRWWILC